MGKNYLSSEFLFYASRKEEREGRRKGGEEGRGREGRRGRKKEKKRRKGGRGVSHFIFFSCSVSYEGGIK